MQYIALCQSLMIISSTTAVLITDHDSEVAGQKITAFDFEVFRYLQGMCAT